MDADVQKSEQKQLVADMKSICHIVLKLSLQLKEMSVGKHLKLRSNLIGHTFFISLPSKSFFLKKLIILFRKDPLS